MRAGVGLNLSLLVVLALLAALHLGLGRGNRERGLEFLPEMVRSVPAEAFAANPVLPGGMTLQEPPAGTIARGWMPLHLAATPEDALRAGEELENPFSPEDPAALKRGQILFGRSCSLCHGPAGAGDGIVAQRGFPAPPSLLAAHARQLKDGQIFHIISFGQGNMPHHASQLDRADRWRAVRAVRELQKAPEPALVPEPALTPGVTPDVAPGAAPDLAPGLAPGLAHGPIAGTVADASPVAGPQEGATP